MQSSAGQRWVALDHIRGIAAFTVFTWHFVHGFHGTPVPFEGAPAIFPLALLDEGHVGVALFMTLSGYLFAKLLNGQDVNYAAFFWNRFLRLVPLLIVVIVLVAVRSGFFDAQSLLHYGRRIASSLYRANLPNGGWSLTVELHFYIALPLLMLLSKRSPLALPLVVAAAICLRFALYLLNGEVQDLCGRGRCRSLYGMAP